MLNQIKQQPWIQPWMPHLRQFRRKWAEICHTPAIWQEEARSKRWSAQIYPQASAIEQALEQVKEQGGYFGSWALGRSALRTLCSQLFSQTEQPLIVEFGSGQSTLFWSYLQKTLPFHFVGFEHDPYWYSQLSPQLGISPEFQYMLSPLKQLTTPEMQALFEHPATAANLFQQMGSPIPTSETSNTRLPNAFYSLNCEDYFEPKSIDGLVLDGPNGNGRAIAFALLWPYLKANAWILIDDFDHYPFLEALGKIAEHHVQHIQINAGKRWCLVQLNN